ncbi:MAG TPA: MdtA/MuxA family multidrug efflux RND transporter periplasmic adaptor subunit [Hyphomicrobiales bacterium]|nr:MdtA/MuxA family multidrug efflux RND transporter periplasmic adaptor subunit [Hyphomicrobiales bacterium]
MDSKVDDKIEQQPAKPPLRPAARQRRRRWIVGAALVVLAAGAGAAYWLGHHVPATSQRAAAPAAGRGRFAGGAGPQPVAVAAAAKGSIPIYFNALGTVTSLATVTVKSQVSGQITDIAFTEGAMVKKGDFLVQIDPRPFQAALDQLQGQLARDQAMLENAKLDLARYEKLGQQNSVAKQTVDTQKATVEADQGTVLSDQAQVEAQKLNLANAHIVSPIDGRVGLRQVDLGNYVQAGDATGLVVITQLQPISAVFSLPEDDLPRLMGRLRTGATLPVTLYDRSDSHEIATGTLATVDNQIDPATGTVKMRAMFPNADFALFPNQFVNARVLVDTLADTVVVPTAAIQQGAPGAFVWVVGDGNQVTAKPVKTGPADGDKTAVISGLAAGDKVVVDGVDRLRDGMRVAIPAARGAGAANAEAGPGSTAAGADAARPAAADADRRARYRAYMQSHGGQRPPRQGGGGAGPAQ